MLRLPSIHAGWQRIHLFQLTNQCGAQETVARIRYIRKTVASPRKMKKPMLSVMAVSSTEEP